ncbi:hypothetical protein J4G37_49110 [Microvirga sp. 3-52]|nr:hypothetical protein [Microvirga sp. 3-52]
MNQMMHLLQFLKNVHYLQEVAVDAVATVETVAADEAVAVADVHSVGAAVHLLEEDAADHVVVVSLEAVAVQAVHVNLNNKVNQKSGIAYAFPDFFVLWSLGKTFQKVKHFLDTFV